MNFLTSILDSIKVRKEELVKRIVEAAVKALIVGAIAKYSGSIGIPLTPEQIQTIAVACATVVAARLFGAMVTPPATPAPPAS